MELRQQDILATGAKKPLLRALVQPFKSFSENYRGWRYQQLQARLAMVEEKTQRVKFKQELVGEALARKEETKGLLKYVIPKERSLSAIHLLGRRFAILSGVYSVFSLSWQDSNLSVKILLIGSFVLVAGLIINGVIIDMKQNSEDLLKVASNFIEDAVAALNRQKESIQREILKSA